MKKLFIVLLIMGITVSSYAGTISRTSYATGGTVTAANLNTNFDTSYNEINGNLDNDNADTTDGFRFYEVLGSVPSAGTQGRLVYDTGNDILAIDDTSAFDYIPVYAGSAAQGEILYYNGSNWATLGVGTSNQVLLTKGASANPQWGDITLDEAYNGGKTITADDGTITINKSDATTALDLNLDSTETGLYIHQDGVLATSKYAAWIYSNANQQDASSKLLFVEQDNSSSDAPAVYIQNDGISKALYIEQNGVLQTNDRGLEVLTTVEQDNSPLVYFSSSNASSSKEILKLNYAGSGAQIVGDGNENLSAAGVWTDRSSTFADKLDIKKIIPSEVYINKLRGMKLYRYQKKCEVYGNKVEKIKNGKKIKEYPNVKKRPNAKHYVGLILDDPTTPEELISRDLEGNINGKSGTQIAEFALTVCKELITKVDKLEARIAVLENR